MFVYCLKKQNLQAQTTQMKFQRNSKEQDSANIHGRWTSISAKDKRMNHFDQYHHLSCISKINIILREFIHLLRDFNFYLMLAKIVIYLCNSYNFKMQVNLNPNGLGQYLSIVQAFMLETHQRINDECDYPSIQPYALSLIDQASIKLKTQKEQIEILQQQLKDAEIAKITYKDIKSQYAHLEKRFNQKTDEISILRETVKTLYQDNQRISGEKQALSKEISGLKETTGQLKRKFKKQEDQISNHRSQMKKITNLTQEKIAEYLKEDEQKQLTIKKLSSQLDRVKSQLNKKEKSFNTTNKKLEELKPVQQQYQKSVKMMERLQQQNQFLLNELESTKNKYFQQKSKLLKETDTLRHELSQFKERIESYKEENRTLITKIAESQDKIVSYENEIIMRTEKLKEKTRQCKTYSEEISKLVKRTEELSEMSDEIMNQNQDLSNRCRELEGQLEEVRTFQTYISKLKGQINHKKSAELNRLMESLGKLQNHA